MGFEEIKNKIDSISMTPNRFIIVSFTDEYYVDSFSDVAKEKVYNKLELALEIRIFGNDNEYLFFRSDISKEFTYRHMEDADECMNGHSDNEYYDEEQFLDIDDTRMEGNTVYATGGGRYNLPIERKKNARIRIRYYYGKYEETGHAYIKDWRVVNFVEGE